MTTHTRHTAMGQRCVVAYPYDFVLDGQCNIGHQYRSPYIAFDPDAVEIAYVDLRIPEDRVAGTPIIPRLWFYPEDLPAVSRGTSVVWRVLISPIRPYDSIAHSPALASDCEAVTSVRNEDVIEEAIFNQLNTHISWVGTIASKVDTPGPNSKLNLQILLERLGADFRDDMPNDARFLKLLLFYTARH